MQVTETLNDGLKRGYTITLPAAELDAKVQQKLTEAQPDIEMKGFRKGKVPMPLLKKQFGQRVLGESIKVRKESPVSRSNIPFSSNMPYASADSTSAHL